MGHSRTGGLPRTRKFQQVAALIGVGARAPQVVSATMEAAERAFSLARRDQGVVETILLLMQLTIAAKNARFDQALRRYGLEVSESPSLTEITVAVSEAIDKRMENSRDRTDLGEIAQIAAIETISESVGSRLPSLFEATPQEVQKEFAKLGTPTQFGSLARTFFSRFIFKLLDSYLSRTLHNHVGEGQRFGAPAQVKDFQKGLRTHCKEAAKIVETYSGDWLSKEIREKGNELSRDRVGDFASFAMEKLIRELRIGARPDDN